MDQTCEVGETIDFEGYQTVRTISPFTAGA